MNRLLYDVYDKLFIQYNLEKIIVAFLVSWIMVKFMLSFRPPQRSMSPASGFILWPVYLRNAIVHRTLLARNVLRKIQLFIVALLLCAIPLVLLLLMNDVNIAAYFGVTSSKLFATFYKKFADILSSANFAWLLAISEAAKFYLFAAIFYIFGALVTFTCFEHGCVHASHPEMLPFLQYSMTLVACVCTVELNKYSNHSGMHTIAAEYLLANVGVVRTVLSTLIILQLLYMIVELVTLLLKRIASFRLPKLRLPGRPVPRSLLSEAEYLEEAETVTRNSLSSMKRQMLAMNSREVWQYVLKLRDPHRVARHVLAEDDDDNSHLTDEEMQHYLSNSRPRLPAERDQELEDELMARRMQAELDNSPPNGYRFDAPMDTEDSGAGPSSIVSNLFSRFIPTSK